MADSRSPLIIGAGPAGLTAALELVKRGVTPRLYEASEDVGGLARTPRRGEWRVDPGGHRFFTRSEAVLDLWRTLLPADQWVAVARRSAMLVQGQRVRYPLVGRDLLTQLGVRSGMRGLGDLLRSRMPRVGRRGVGSESFEDWGTREFGRHWYTLFFDGYVRKTWLADPADLTSDWANQRIRPIRWRKAGDFAARDVFRYPRLGPGQLWEAAAAVLADSGVVTSLNSPVVKVGRVGRTWTVDLQNGETASGDAVFSSMPLRSLIDALEPAPPHHVRAAAAALKHRALITVGVALRDRIDLPYNWIYTPSGHMRVGRIQNYSRWSPALAPVNWGGTYLGMEYFTNTDGDLWRADDGAMAAIVDEDLRALGVGACAVEHVMVVRSQYAYPVYDPARETSVALIRDFLRRHHPSLRPMGRNGMHHYDNQDHAMLSAMQSVARYFGDDVDPWRVNTDLRYQESGLLSM
ncbi:protoporphyrinogen oxidase [Mycobacterium sp. IS-1742]|uniref:NAD(P)/FAD-dependent oxidoreductase n=1 Tax=Mycobacterium sp. IS-1742 TaxID=1772285 RepID=UPI00073FFC2A|nr:NAD(P)/FAD-dependent oxidoreductase [Mycobacterium sp. IS-1742]KUI27210.1 protoporphyrinogen oxidase [Mycobacterium sp. IS-1742]